MSAKTDGDRRGQVVRLVVLVTDFQFSFCMCCIDKSTHGCVSGQTLYLANAYLFCFLKHRVLKITFLRLFFNPKFRASQTPNEARLGVNAVTVTIGFIL